MKPLFWIGLIVFALGLLSLIVPLPSTQHEGVSIGDVSIGVETHSSEKLSPIVAAVMLLAGASMMIVARKGA